MERTRRLALLGIGVCCLLLGDNSAQKVQVTKTERSDFPPGGTLHLKNSIGELTIEGWDQPDLEITTIKSSKTAVEGIARDKATKLLDSVKIAMERKGDEVIVSTDFRKNPKIERPFKGMTDFDLEYRIKVPRNARLTIEHNLGGVHVDSVSGEIHATNEMGLITVREPEGQYAIDAKSKLGAVDCDFPGSEKTVKWLGHAFLGGNPTAAQKIFLRIQFGDVIILRMHQPQPAAAASGK
jgi:hypothetical protein